jgi:agmatinase
MGTQRQQQLNPGDATRVSRQHNFLALRGELATRDRARAWVLPIPYEGTVCYGKGASQGPAAILAASSQVELYDYEFQCEPYRRYGVHTLPAIRLGRRSPAGVMQAIEERVASILTGKLKPEVLAILGGEHSISGGVSRGIVRAGIKDFVTVQVDAHCDLRDEYDGTRFSHACAARRITEVSPVFQIGIRNMGASEAEYFRKSGRVQIVCAGEALAGKEYLKKLARYVRGKQVYLTMDLDGLDPAEMPAVGTPEPGGLHWQQLMDIVHTVFREAKRVPVFDVVELAPIPCMTGPDFLAAKLVYKVMSLALCR